MITQSLSHRILAVLVAVLSSSACATTALHAQDLEVSIGRFYDSTGWTAYRLGVTRPLGGILRFQVHGDLLRLQLLFQGRPVQLDELVGLIGAGESRMITMVGPGGRPATCSAGAASSSASGPRRPAAKPASPWRKPSAASASAVVMARGVTCSTSPSAV